MPSRKIAPASLNWISPVATVFSAAGASRMNGSQRAPANARTPCPDPPFSSLTRNATVSPAGVVHVPSCAKGCASVGAENTVSNTNSCSPGANGAGAPGVATSGRSRKRYSRPSESGLASLANGSVFITSTR